MGIFIVVELILGGLVGELIMGRYMSIALRFVLQGLLHLSAFFAGGVIVGLISPGLRIKEPAAGAFCAVALMLLLTVFTPYTFMRFSTDKLLIGGIIAYALALLGARLGERLAGNLR